MPRCLACLRAEGCNEGQGYLFSKAQPQREVAAFLENGKAKKTAA
jgi:EAL domain-containing protein (putative c-di-GMP-specific phosphodiesterase class I)